MINRKKIQKENAAYDALVAAGYLPQGRNCKGKCVVKIPDGHNEHGFLAVWEFNSWQDAADHLINK